jgi:cell division protein FtsB
VKLLVVVLLILLGLLQYRLWFGDSNLRQVRIYQQQIEELQQEGARRKQRNQLLEAEVLDLKNGLEAVEERARQDLGMIKKGETFFQVIEPRPTNNGE